MLTCAVGAPFTVIAIGSETDGVPATGEPSAARTACSTPATRFTRTTPGTAFAGTRTFTDTGALAPGSRVSTTSDNVTHDAPLGAPDATTAERRTVTRIVAVRLTTTIPRVAALPGPTVTASPSIPVAAPATRTPSAVAGTSTGAAFVVVVAAAAGSASMP